MVSLARSANKLLTFAAKKVFVVNKGIADGRRRVAMVKIRCLSKRGCRSSRARLTSPALRSKDGRWVRSGMNPRSVHGRGLTHANQSSRGSEETLAMVGGGIQLIRDG